jgi:hypothetical protein
MDPQGLSELARAHFKNDTAAARRFVVAGCDAGVLPPTTGTEWLSYYSPHVAAYTQRGGSWPRAVTAAPSDTTARAAPYVKPGAKVTGAQRSSPYQDLLRQEQREKEYEVRKKLAWDVAGDNTRYQEATQILQSDVFWEANKDRLMKEFGVSNVTAAASSRDSAYKNKADARAGPYGGSGGAVFDSSSSDDAGLRGQIALLIAGDTARQDEAERILSDRTYWEENRERLLRDVVGASGMSDARGGHYGSSGDAARDALERAADQPTARFDFPLAMAGYPDLQDEATKVLNEAGYWEDNKSRLVDELWNRMSTDERREVASRACSYHTNKRSPLYDNEGGDGNDDDDADNNRAASTSERNGIWGKITGKDKLKKKQRALEEENRELRRRDRDRDSDRRSAPYTYAAQGAIGGGGVGGDNDPDAEDLAYAMERGLRLGGGDSATARDGLFDRARDAARAGRNWLGGSEQTALTFRFNERATGYAAGSGRAKLLAAMLSEAKSPSTFAAPQSPSLWAEEVLQVSGSSMEFGSGANRLEVTTSGYVEMQLYPGEYIETSGGRKSSTSKVRANSVANCTLELKNKAGGQDDNKILEMVQLTIIRLSAPLPFASLPWKFKVGSTKATRNKDNKNDSFPFEQRKFLFELDTLDGMSADFGASTNILVSGVRQLALRNDSIRPAVMHKVTVLLVGKEGLVTHVYFVH